VKSLNPKVLTDTARILKNIPRTGWLQRGIPHSIAETVAEHSFEVASLLAVITMEVGEGLDKEKLLVMGIVHDWGEAVAGDIPRSLTRRLGKDTKSRAEKKIMHELAVASGFKNLSEVFEEYEERKSKEAIIAKIADLISTWRQACTYADRGYNVEDIVVSCREELEDLISKAKDERVIKVVRKLL
jgi:putative hydrolase of HD superfamily